MATRRNEQDKLIEAQQATINELRALIADLRAMLATMEARSNAREAELTAKLDALTRKFFGKKSEKMPTPAKELRKAGAPELAAAIAQDNRKRNEQRKNELESDTVEHSVPEPRRVCPACASSDLRTGAPLQRVDYGYVPGYFRRRVHQQEVLVCSCCATNIVADAPARPFDKSRYEAGLIAHVIVQKCACSVPHLSPGEAVPVARYPTGAQHHDGPVSRRRPEARAAVPAPALPRRQQQHRAR